MLHNLYVKNLALIDEIEVEFTKGSTLMSGVVVGITMTAFAP